MKNGKKRMIFFTAFTLVLLSVAGYLFVSADAGTEQDPLVTLSYVNEVLKPQMTEELQTLTDRQKADFSAELDGKIKAADDRLSEKLDELFRPGTETDAAVTAAAEDAYEKLVAKIEVAERDPSWDLLRLTAGQTVTCSIGCEILVRIGSGTCVSSGTTGPIDMTDGSVLEPNKEYKTNHLYLVTIEGRGLKAGKNGCTFLIKGNYTLS